MMAALDFVWIAFALNTNDKGTPSLEVKVMGFDRGIGDERIMDRRFVVDI